MKICRITRETSCKLRNTNSSPTFPYISAYVNEEKKKKKKKAWGTELMYFIFAKIKGKWNSTRIYLIWTRSARFDGGNFMRSILFKNTQFSFIPGLFIYFIYLLQKPRTAQVKRYPWVPLLQQGHAEPGTRPGSFRRSPRREALWAVWTACASDLAPTQRRSAAW